MSTTTLTRPAITVNATDLKPATAWATKGLSRRPSQPILAGLQLDTTDTGLLIISGFDHETYSSIAVRYEGERWPTTLLVHGQTITDMVSRLSGPVTLTPGERTLEIRAGRTRYEVLLMPNEDYPPLPPAAPAAGTVDADTLTELVTAAFSAALKPGGDPLMLTGLRMFTRDGNLHLIATDRYRAAHLTTPWDGSSLDVLAPPAFLTAIRGTTGPIKIGADAHRITVEAADRTSTLTLIAADYPPMERFWRDTPGVSVTLNRTELLHAVQAVAVAAERNTPVRFKFEDDAVSLDAGGNATHTTGETTVDTLGIDQRVDADWNPHLLSDVLGAINATHVQFDFMPAGLGLKPVEIHPAASDGERITGAAFVLQPIRFGGTGR